MKYQELDARAEQRDIDRLNKLDEIEDFIKKFLYSHKHLEYGLTIPDGSFAAGYLCGFAKAEYEIYQRLLQKINE